MTNPITQDELDALLASIAVAEGQRRQPQQAASASLYDFRHAAKLSPDQLRALRHRVLALATVLGRTLGLYLGLPVDFRVHSMDLASYDQYVRNLEPNPVLGVVSVGAGAPLAMWELSRPLALVALDRMLGGPGAPEADGGQEMPPLSRAVLARFFHEVLSAWGELWPPLQALGPRVEGVTTAPAAVDAGSGEERFFYALLAVRLGEARGLLRLCLPLSAVRGLLREERDTTPAAGTEAAADLNRGPLAVAPVRVAARLEVPPLCLNNLLRLQPGEVLDLRLPADTPFTVCLSDNPKFRAVAGVSAGRVAVKFTGEIA